MTKGASLQSVGVGDPRINWHPLVHQRFDEDLYFVVFRLAQSTDVLSTLDDLVQEAGVNAYCSYVVFGHFDALLRAWLTPPHWQRLLRVVSRYRERIPEIRYLKAGGIRYLWSSHGISNLFNGVPDRTGFHSADRRQT